MLNNIACIGIFTKTLGVDLNVVDIGMKNDIKREYPNLIHRKVKRGTNNFYKEKSYVYGRMSTSYFYRYRFNK